MRFARKFARSFSKTFSRGFAGSAGSTLFKYFLYIIKGSTTDIEPLTGGGYGYKPYGTGAIEIPITNVAGVNLLTDTVLQTDYNLELYGVTIVNFIGTAVLSISGTGYVVDTAGTAFYLKDSMGNEYWFQDGDGIEIYSSGKLIPVLVVPPVNGSINVVSTMHNVGDNIPISLIANEGYEASLEVDSVPVSNPYNLVVSASHIIRGYISSILTTILDTFSQVPVKIGSDWVFPDSSGFGNHLPIKSKNIKTNITNSSVLFSSNSLTAIGTSDFTLILKYKNTSLGTFCYYRPPGSSYFIAIAQSGIDKIKCGLSATYAPIIIYSNNLGLGDTIPYLDEVHEIIFQRQGTSLMLYVDKSYHGAITMPIECDLTSYYNWSFGARFASGAVSERSECELYNFEFYKRILTYSEVIEHYDTGEIVNKDNLIIKTNFDKKTDGTFYDVQNGITGTALNVAENFVTDKRPYVLTNGFSINGSDIIPAKLDGLTDVLGNTIQYPAGSGIVDGLTNEYFIPVDAELNTIIPTGWYTYAQLLALLESENLIKTVVGNAITQMIAKKKN